ncbi:arylsulfatase [Flavivirga spongiicola]|uniref:Arylsulfatase n=1 Tax=Flavivirga spongiicola TaxID=421621 RepID=A0ABU7XWP2_9FLAO|nr:arylsulfatase [Flavivirga sp. MEBiC05379]MDO5980198.1 arylsulfatase [Flavivirga sp. MEBiC05379]
MHLKHRLLLIFSFTFFFFNNCEKKEKIEKDKPNIIVIMADDIGYSDLGCYGGEIATPNLDLLAKNGIRFNKIYNSSRCCPTRASLLTGLYPHNAGIGGMTVAAGKEGPEGPYQGYLSRKSVTIAEALSASGYNSYLSGKWHVGEGIENWPLKRGFKRYFGLISGASSYFEVIKNQERKRQMVLDSLPWEPPAKGFYMTDAITDYAIEWMHDADKTKETPFFLYVAYTAPHWPLHALPEDIAKYKGTYNIGWDSLRLRRFKKLKDLHLIDAHAQLSKRPNSIPAWEDVDNKEDWVRRMEVYAAMVDRMDQGVGKIIETLKSQGQLENTLILFLSDNGGSDENIESRGLNDPEISIGDQGSYAAYCAPWANLSNTPFRFFKKSTYEGGIASPFIAHWPNEIKNKGSIINQLGSVTDLLPTFLDIANTTYPLKYNGHNIKPTNGISLLPALKSNISTNREALFWEHEGSKAVRQGKWKGVTNSASEWELYDMYNDPSEINNLAEVYQDTLDVLVEKYNHWANEIGINPQN